jgi:Flp pilus assembly protein TadG
MAMTASLIRFLLWRHDPDAGSAAVEFAIAAPLLLVMALGIADYGMLMNNIASLEGATRAVAEFARNASVCSGGGLSNTDCVTGISDLVASLKSNDNSLSSASFSYPQSDLSAAGGNYCTCVDGSAVDCSTGTCNVSGDTRVVQYIQVSATEAFSPLFALTNFGYLPRTTFGFPSSLAAQTTVRIE